VEQTVVVERQASNATADVGVKENVDLLIGCGEQFHSSKLVYEI
jgi:hypothetical protein